MDTSVASHLHPSGRYAELFTASVRAGTPVVVAAPTAIETIYGFARHVSATRTAATDLAWYRTLFAGPFARVLPVDASASILAGELRALHSLPPAVARSDGRTKPERRVAWVLDVLIAATAWTAGYGIATRNRGDFEVLRDLIEELHPGVTPLVVEDPPGPHRWYDDVI